MSGVMRFIRNPFRRRNTVHTPVITEPISATVEDWFTKSYKGATWNTAWSANLTEIHMAYKLWIERYNVVSLKTGVPAEVVCAIHNRESSGVWHRVLHNGERLTDVNRRGTKLVPKGRGKGKNWSWEMAAIDALLLKKGIFPDKWTISATLDFIERYNGLGYRKYHKDVNTPYLWCGTQFYTRGGYPSDGKWSSTYVNKSIGCVPILRTLGFKGE